MTDLLYFSLFYSFIISLLIFGLCRSIRKHKHIQSDAKKFISVIIACKNEEMNIGKLIQSLKDQSYDKEFYEVIIADDNSTDSTATKIKESIQHDANFHYVFVAPESFSDILGKKKAITTAVQIAKGNILAFTDADCIPERDWLSDINQAFEKCDFYAGYSPLILNKYQNIKNLERASIFAVCAGSLGLRTPLTCTARNMAYTRDLWDKVEGFKGIGHILSGDDDLMLLKMRNFTNRYHFSFNPNAIVISEEKNNLSKQINQETRRASKFKYYPLYIKLLIVSIAIYYVLLLYNFIASFFTMSVSCGLLFAIASKLILEFLLLFIFLNNFKKTSYLKTFLIAELLYIPYFLFFGIKGTLGKYKWKS